MFWTDARNYLTTSDDVFMQRVLANGEIAPGWPATGLVISDTIWSQRGFDLIADGAGGAIALWKDERRRPSPGLHPDLFAQRVRPDGTLAPGWLPLGSPVSLAPGSQLPQGTRGSAPDGSGGALFLWEDRRDFPTLQVDIYMQHLTGTGVPAAGWPADGRVVASLPEEQRHTMLASDGAGGGFATWIDYRNLPGEIEQGKQGETFGTHVLGNGSEAPGWTPGGRLLRPGRGRPGGIVPDGVGGVYVVHALPGLHAESVWVAQRLTGTGEPVLGWPADGIILCDAPGGRDLGPSCGDGLGGLLVSWADGRDGEVYVTRIRPDGTLPPGWPEDGLRVSGLEPTPYGEDDPALAPDGQGGCYVAWEHPTSCCVDALIQHILPSGTIAPGWPAAGLKVQSLGGSAENLSLVADGLGGAIIVYSVFPDQPYLQKFVSDGVVAADVSLVSAEARSDAVELRWYVGGEPGFTATLERRSLADDVWRELAEVAADGTGAIVYADRAVSPGERYAYRLRWSEHGAVRTTTETWVETPAGLQFVLHGLQPNPSQGDAYAAFTLPGRAAGELELLDVGGRRVLAREIGTLGPGRHVVPLAAGTPVPPGLYLVRLRWSDRVATSRAIVMR